MNPSSQAPFANHDLHAQHVQMCLNTLATLANCMNVVNPRVENFDDEAEAKPLSKEGTLALEVSIIKVCNRLDALFDDSRLWKLPDTDSRDILITSLMQQLKMQGHQLQALDARQAIVQAVINSQNEPPKGPKKGRKNG